MKKVWKKLTQTPSEAKEEKEAFAFKLLAAEWINASRSGDVKTMRKLLDESSLMKKPHQ